MLLSERSPFEELGHALESLGRRFDTEPVDPVDVSHVVAELALPDDLVNVYLAGSPMPGSSVPWAAEDLWLYSVKELASAQEGYRWTGQDKHQLPSWPAHWVTVASASGDPFIADVSHAVPPILFARHGAGSWQGTIVATTLTQFVHAVEAVQHVLIGRFNGDVWDDEGPKQEFLSVLADGLRAVVSAEEAAALLDAIAG